MSPLEELLAQAASHDRCVWLDPSTGSRPRGGGASGWSGTGPLIGWCRSDDVSLTYRASTREVTRHVEGRSEVVGDDIFTVLEAELARGAPDGHPGQWFGYLGYAARPDLPAAVDPAGVPDAVWMRPRHLLGLPSVAGAAPGAEPGPVVEPVETPGPVVEPVETPAAYRAAFAAVQEALHAGHTYELNLTYRESATSHLSPAALYLRLRQLNPAPYAGFLQHRLPGGPAGHDAWLLSSSPERYARVTRDARGAVIEARPIKGTTPRGVTMAEDRAAAELLASHPRFRAENLMIVDLLRNDLSMVCDPGTVTVPSLMQVETYPSVHQLVSTVSGRLRAGVTTVQALRALFPAGSMTGAPKLRTMEITQRVEGRLGGARGAYAGAFGCIGADGSADLGVVIRSLSSPDARTWTLGTGGGITVHSTVEEEYAETRWKAERLLRALGPAAASAAVPR